MAKAKPDTANATPATASSKNAAAVEMGLSIAERNRRFSDALNVAGLRAASGGAALSLDEESLLDLVCPDPLARRRQEGLWEAIATHRARAGTEAEQAEAKAAVVRAKSELGEKLPAFEVAAAKLETLRSEVDKARAAVLAAEGRVDAQAAARENLRDLAPDFVKRHHGRAMKAVADKYNWVAQKETRPGMIRDVIRIASDLTSPMNGTRNAEALRLHLDAIKSPALRRREGHPAEIDHRLLADYISELKAEGPQLEQKLKQAKADRAKEESELRGMLDYWATLEF